jgi:hypothetical protein
MKTIKRDQLYRDLSGFLKTRGVELTEGPYAHNLRQACGLLAEAINLTQRGVRQTKATVDRKLEEMRQSIHEATAPKPPPAKPARRAAPKKRAARKPARAAAPPK